MANLGDATLELKTDNSDLESGLQDAEGSVESFGVAAAATLTAMGATIGLIINDAVDTFTDLGDSIHKMSLRTNLSTEFLTGFNHVLEQGGSSIGEFEAGLRKFTMLMGVEMPEQSAKAVEIQEKLNITTRELEQLLSGDMENAVRFFIERLAQSENHFEMAGNAMLVFGGAGLKLLPTLKNTEEQMAQLFEEAEMLNVILTQEMVDSAAALTDAFHEQEQAITRLKMEIGFALAPELQRLAEVTSKVVAMTTDFAAENQKLSNFIIITAGSMAVLSTAIGVLRIAFVLLNASLGKALIVFGAITVASAVLGFAISHLDTIIHAFKVTVNVVFEMVGNMIESAINKAVYHINFLIDGVNKVIGIFDQEIPKIPEATIDWSNTFAIETEKIVENTEKQGEAIEETAQKVEESFRREELALDKKADAYDIHYDELSMLQQAFDHRTIRRTKETAEEIKKIFATPDEIRRSMDARGLTTGIDTTPHMAGRNQFMESARSGVLQVAATDELGNALRDERGGVIFRDATRADASRHQTARDFFGVQDHAVNSLTGSNSLNTPIMNSPVTNEQSLTVNLDSKVIDVALMNTVAHERVLE